MARQKLVDNIRNQTKGATRTKKQIKRGSSKIYEIVKNFGPEPNFENVTLDSKDYNTKYIRALTWASNAFDLDELKDFFIDYAQENEMDVQYYKSLPKYEFSGLGKICWLITKGCPLSENTKEYFSNKIEKLNNLEVKEAEETSEDLDDRKLSVEQKVTLKYVDLYSELDSFIEIGEDIENKTYELLSRDKTSLRLGRKLLEHYNELSTDIIKELNDVPKRKKESKQYREILNSMNENILIVLNVLKSYTMNLENVNSSNRKVKKTPRTKTKSNTKMISKLKYKEKDDTYNLTSINPESIIGAKILLVFNAKYKKFGIYYSETTEGFGVKGTTLTNFKEDYSLSKNLRKPEEQIPLLSGSNKKELDKNFKNIKAAESKLTGRINNETLLIKVYK